MLGAVVYILQAEEDGWLPEFTGRIMHGTFFHMIEESSSELADFIHNEMIIKPFTVSDLQACQPQKVKGKGKLIKRGDLFRWRVTVLHESLLSILLNAELDEGLLLNKQPMLLKDIIVDGEKDRSSGILEEEQLISHCLSERDFSQLRLDFVSPATFRVDDVDYPLPTPALTFNSFAKKWQQLNMPFDISLLDMENIFSRVYIRKWQGESKSIYLTPQRGINTFTGSFVYDFSHLELDEKRFLLLLAQFGVFAGCGRLSTQGMGQIRVKYR